MTFIEKMVQESTRYNPGIWEEYKERIQISSTSVSEPLLRLFYKRTGAEENKNDFKISESQIGTLFHRGMEVAASEVVSEEGHSHSQEYSINHPAENVIRSGDPKLSSFVLTTTIDLLIEVEELSTIHDYKLVKKYRGDVLLKKNIESVFSIDSGIEVNAETLDSYTIQMLFNAMMIKESHRERNLKIKLIIDIFRKDSAPARGEEVHMPVEIDQKIVDYFLIENEEGVSRIKEYVNRQIMSLSVAIEENISKGTIPDRCNDTWTRKNPKGPGTIGMRCTQFCEFSQDCDRTTDMEKDFIAIAKLTDGF